MTDRFLDFALRLAAAARTETLPRWRTGCAVANKAQGGDWDPVTDADREGERAIRRLIESEYPDHGVAGEEYGERFGSGRYCWSIDPVDGTRAFVCGVPSWTTLIALLDEGRPVLGVVDAPALGEIYVGAGEGFLVLGDGRSRLRTSDCAALGEACVSTTDPFLFDDREAAAWDRIRRASRTARYGLDAYGYARLAAGSLDLVVESGLKPHDYNALVPVVRAAGGTIGDWEGGEDFSRGRVIAAAGRALYEEAVEAVSAA
jgi:myo-inositol-1(or 4)-monophosphatase